MRSSVELQNEIIQPTALLFEMGSVQDGDTRYTNLYGTDFTGVVFKTTFL
jgi:hypothetical protein